MLLWKQPYTPALLLHFNLPLTVTMSLLTYTSPTLLTFIDHLSGVTPHMKEPDAPSPIHVGKPEAQKCEMASATRGADRRSLCSSHLQFCTTQGNTVHRVILFTGQHCSQNPCSSSKPASAPMGHGLASCRNTSARLEGNLLTVVMCPDQSVPPSKALQPWLSHFQCFLGYLRHLQGWG